MSRPSLVVFAAGQGTRLRPLTDETPKAMVPVLDVPLIDLALDREPPVDWAATFVNVSGKSAGLREHLKTRHPKVAVFEEGPLPIGQAATLKSLLPRLSEPLVTYNCDLVSDLELAALLRYHAKCGEQCTLAVREVERGADLASAGGSLRLIDRRFEDRPGYLFLGSACFDLALLQAIPQSRPLGLVAGVLQRALDARQVALFEHRGYACDAGTPGRYLDASLAMLKSPEAAAWSPGTVSPDGWYLGPKASANGASLGRGAIVLAGAVAEPGADLHNCVVWPGSVVPAGSRLSEGIWFRNRWLPSRT